MSSASCLRTQPAPERRPDLSRLTTARPTRPLAPAPIPLTSPDALGVTRTYADWQAITDDVVNARVWEGVHFRTSDITGVDQGLRVARWEVGRLAEIGL